MGSEQAPPAASGSAGGGVRCWRRSRWAAAAAAAGALLVALLAVAVSSRSFPAISSYSRGGGCGCPGARKYTGMVEDCCCDYETVDAINEEVLHPILQELVALPFFRYFKVRLDPSCLRVRVAPPEFSSSPASPQLSTSPSWTIDVPNARTIKVTNISASATVDNIKEFFSFSGDIKYVEMRRESETSQVAYVTFKEFHGADTALLLSGATISDVSVNITPVEDYELPPEAYSHEEEMSSPRTPTEAAVKKAEEVVSTMLARGFVLSKDALKRARSFDDRHQLLSLASARVARLDRRFGLSEKLTLGMAAARGAVRGVDKRFQVSELTRSVITTAEQHAATLVAASPYASRGAAWVSSAVGAVARAAVDVGARTMEKVEMADREVESPKDAVDGVDSAQPPKVHAVQVDDVPVHAHARADQHGRDSDQKIKASSPGSKWHLPR